MLLFELQIFQKLCTLLTFFCNEKWTSKIRCCCSRPCASLNIFLGHGDISVFVWRHNDVVLCCSARRRCGSVVAVFSAPARPSVRHSSRSPSSPRTWPSLIGRCPVTWRRCPVTWDNWSPSTNCWPSTAPPTSTESCPPRSRDDVTTAMMTS